MLGNKKSGMFVLLYKSTAYTKMRKYSLVVGGRRDLGKSG